MFPSYSGVRPPKHGTKKHHGIYAEIASFSELVHQSLFPARLRKSMHSEQLTGHRANRARRNAVFGEGVLIPPKCAFCNGIDSSLNGTFVVNVCYV